MENAMNGAAEKAALRLLASLFFIWGFITVINNTLLPHLKSVFDLNYVETTLMESVWFVAYFVASIPSAKLIERVGYRRAMLTGLIIMASGALLMIPAARLPSYGITLAALFVIAGGITLLQVAANPYVAVVGPADRASSRLNFVQAFNSLGTTLAPLFGGYLILGRSTSGTSQSGIAATAAERLMDARAVQLPYLIVAAVLIVLAVVIARCRLPDMGAQTRRASAQERRAHSLWHHRNLVLGVPAIFIYLIAEIGVSNLFISFVSQPTVGNLTHEQASHYLFLLWGGMMVGRFAGSLMMRFIPGERVLAWFAFAALATMLVTCFAHGPARDGGTDSRRTISFDHVPHHLYPGYSRTGSAHRGGVGPAHHGDRRRGAGHRSGLAGRSFWIAALLPADGCVRVVRHLLRAMGRTPASQRTCVSCGRRRRAPAAAGRRQRAVCAAVRRTGRSWRW